MIIKSILTLCLIPSFWMVGDSEISVNNHDDASITLSKNDDSEAQKDFTKLEFGEDLSDEVEVIPGIYGGEDGSTLSCIGLPGACYVIVYGERNNYGLVNADIPAIVVDATNTIMKKKTVSSSKKVGNTIVYTLVDA